MKNWLVVLGMVLLPLGVISRELKPNWILEKAEIVYTVTHPLHAVHGKSLSAKGKGVCYDGRCEFLVAGPGGSFDSWDKNRDLHILGAAKVGPSPFVVGRAAT